MRSGKLRKLRSKNNVSVGFGEMTIQSFSGCSRVNTAKAWENRTSRLILEA